MDYSNGWIDLGTPDIVKFIQTVHELSSAQGFGFIQDKPEPLSDEEIQPYIDNIESCGSTRLDYLRGRSVKMSIHKHEGNYFIPNFWYDHSDVEFDELLSRFGCTLITKEKHNPSCECDQCKPNNPIRDSQKALQLCELDIIAYPPTKEETDAEQ